jgi:tetratricopeptide (TPR) repeat protein
VHLKQVADELGVGYVAEGSVRKSGDRVHVTRQDNVVAQALLEKAISIDPHYGRALGLLATSRTFCAHMGWDDRATTLPIAERAARMAIRADGDNPWAHLALGNVQLFARRFDDSLGLSPRDPCAAIYYGIAAYAQFVSRNYDAAMQLARESLRQRGDFVGAHRVLTAAAGLAGDKDTAKAALAGLLRAQPNVSLAWIATEMPIRDDGEW